MKSIEWICRLLGIVIAFDGVTVMRDSDPYAGQPCDEYGNKVHISVYGDVRCCTELTCPKGTAPQMCNLTDRSTTMCVQCLEDHYMPWTTESVYMYRCLLRRRCPSNSGLRIKRNGTVMSDNECECDVKIGYWEADRQHYEGICGYEECDIGHELTEIGCQPCRHGMYKTNKSIAMCIHWRDCAARGMIPEPNGNTSHDHRCVNGTISFNTGLSRDGDHDDDGDVTPIIATSLMGGFLLCLLPVFILCLIRRRRHRMATSATSLGQRAGPLTYTEVMTSPPYIYDSPGQQIYSKEPLEVMLPAPPKYEESWTRVPVHQPGSVTEETECDGVEEDAELCDDNDDGVTPPPSPSQDDTTTLPVTGKGRPTVITITADTVNVQVGSRNGMDISN